jgi:hypothetical protein
MKYALSPSLSTIASRFSSYNGPYEDPANDDGSLSPAKDVTLAALRTHPFKKQHVHWPDVATNISRKQLFPDEHILDPTVLTESPSMHRHLSPMPTPYSALSHVLQTAILPAGSTAGVIGASKFITPSR